MSDRTARGEPPDDLATWYTRLREEIRAKPPDELDRELPNLADQVSDLAHTGDDLAIGVSFSTRYTGLDYSIHRVHGDDDPYLEPIKEPVTETHRYVRFTHPADNHFDASALRARLLGAVERERRDVQQPTSRFAEIWSHL